MQELSLEVKDQAMQYSCTLIKQNKGTNKDELVKVTSGCSFASYYAEKDEAGGLRTTWATAFSIRYGGMCMRSQYTQDGVRRIRISRMFLTT